MGIKDMMLTDLSIFWEGVFFIALLFSFYVLCFQFGKWVEKRKGCKHTIKVKEYPIYFKNMDDGAGIHAGFYAERTCVKCRHKETEVYLKAETITSIDHNFEFDTYTAEKPRFKNDV
jgi:hypothetical protein